MRLALADAKMAPEEIGYLNAHGTSTPFNDANETKAIKTVFGPHARKLMVSSTKSMTGHMLGAAGGAEAVVGTLALTRGVIPRPSTTPRPIHRDLDYAQQAARGVGRRGDEQQLQSAHQRGADPQAPQQVAQRLGPAGGSPMPTTSPLRACLAVLPPEVAGAPAIAGARVRPGPPSDRWTQGGAGVSLRPCWRNCSDWPARRGRPTRQKPAFHVSPSRSS
jgi:hypothetical protein